MSKLRNIPKHWQVKKLGDISDEIKPGYPSGNHNTESIGVLHFRPYNITTDGRIDLSNIKHVPLKSDTYFLRKGDVIFNNTNSPELLGKTCLISKSENWVYSNHMTRIRVKKEVLPQFCAIYLHFLFYKGFYQANCSNHVNQASISTSFLSKFVSIPIPPVEEQQQIVSKIEALFSELNKGKQQLETAQKQLKVYRQSLLKTAFEGRLTTTKNIKWAKLGDNAFVTKLAGFEFTKHVRYKEAGEIPVIRAQNVSKMGFVERNFIYVDREIMERLPRSRVFGGEILMVFVGAGLGNVGIVPNHKEFFLGPNVAKIAVNENYYNKFIYYFLFSSMGFGNVSGMSKATAQGSISMGNIREVSVPILPLKEQTKIVAEIESRFSVCDKLEENIAQALQRAETLRQSILKQAFEGKLVQMETVEVDADLDESMEKLKNVI